MEKRGVVGAGILRKYQLEENIEHMSKESYAYNGYMNNFSLHLPGGFYRCSLSEKMDKPKSKSDTGRSSMVARRQTLREFYATVDKALAQSGVDTVEVQKIIDDGKEDALYRKNLAIRPAYELLRQWGYTKGELTT
jgi:hypothetical protein